MDTSMSIMDCKKTLRKYSDCIPARVVVGFLLFVASFLIFGHQVNLNIALVSMVNHTETKESSVASLECSAQRDTVSNSTQHEQTSSQGGEFLWSPATQGMVLGALFYGAISSHAAGGLLVHKFNAANVGLLSLSMVSLLSLLIPISSKVAGATALFVIRVLQGVFLGFFMPVSYALVGRWSPVMERTMFVSLLHVGGVLGGAITTVMTGYINAYGFLGGWPFNFYLSGGFGLLFCVLWYFFAYESPDDHPTISPDELLYLSKPSDSRSAAEKRSSVPWKAVAKSVPFWSLLLVRFTGTWGFNTLTFATPLYLQTALMMPVEQNGLVNGLLFLASVLSSLISGTIADLLRKKTCMSITAIRKTMSGLAYVSAAFCWFSITSTGCNTVTASIVIISTKLAVSLCIGGDFAAIMDMAPQYAGPLAGITYTISDMTGVLSPLLTGIITNSDVSLGRWHLVFCVAAGIQLFGLAQFLVLGSAELQPWAESPDDIKKTKTKKNELTESGPLINEGKRTYDTISVTNEC